MGATLLTIHEVALYLHVTERTVYRFVREHTMPAYKLGGSWRFKPEQVEAWMEGQKNAR